MARVNNLTNFLNDVAAAIKQKLGDNTPIPASQFDTKIGEIETGGNYQTKSISITTNGNYTQLPDTGYDAMDQVVISVNVPQTGGAVKLFETEQAMQADPNPSEGDLAVVYREEIQAVTEESEFSSCIFPNTVVLDTAFSDDIYVSFRSIDQSIWFNCLVQVSSSSFSLDGHGESGNVRVQYTSSDGITYIRTDGGEELQEFGTSIKYEPYEPWNDVIGKFMKIGGKYFEGLYECGVVPAQLKGNLLSDLAVTDGNISANHSITINIVYDELVERILSMATHIKALYSHDSYSRYPFWCGLKDANTVVLLSSGGGSTPTSVMYLNPVFKYDTGAFMGMETSSGGANNAYEFSFNINTGTYIATNVIPLALTNPDGSHHWNYTTDFNNYYMLGVIDYNSMNETFTWMDKYAYCLSNTIHSSTSNNTPSIIEGLRYSIASTQLTLKNANELLPNITAYGKNGVVTGDGSVYNNLDNGYILQNIYNLPQINPTLYGYNIKSTAVPNNINIPKAKGCYIKPSTYTNNALFDISNVIKTGSTNYLSNSGNYYVNNKIVYDSRTHESVRDLGQIYMLGYYNGCVLYTKEQVQPTVSSIIYKYDIDNNAEVSIGSTAAISSSYNWTYKYTHFLVLGNILICDANGENNSPKLIAANLKVCNLDTGVECVIYNHQNTISSGSNLGYSVTPILVSDNKLVIFERFKNSSGSYIYYMYDYTINTNTLLVKANATTTQLIRSSINYMYKEGYCIVDNYAIVVQDSYAYALNISQPTAMISISSDSALKTCIVNYKDGSVPYTYDSVTTRWRCVTNITYNGATNLSFTFGDYLPFGNNCPLYTLEGTSIGLISSADAVTYTFDSVNSKYIATSKKGNIIGINMNVEPYILTTTNDASRYIIDGNADSSSHYKLLSVFDII